MDAILLVNNAGASSIHEESVFVHLGEQELGDREGLPYIFTNARHVGETLAVSLLYDDGTSSKLRTEEGTCYAVITIT